MMILDDLKHIANVNVAVNYKLFNGPRWACLQIIMDDR